MTPQPPLLTGDINEDVYNIWIYLTDISSYIDSTPDGGWSVVGATPLRTITVGMSLADLTNVVATLMSVLVQKGMLSNGV